MLHCSTLILISTNCINYHITSCCGTQNQFNLRKSQNNDTTISSPCLNSCESDKSILKMNINKSTNHANTWSYKHRLQRERDDDSDDSDDDGDDDDDDDDDDGNDYDDDYDEDYNDTYDASDNDD